MRRRTVPAVLIGVLSLLCSAAAAEAATVAVEERPGTGPTVVVRGEPGDEESITVQFSHYEGGSPKVDVYGSDIRPGAGCAADGYSYTCAGESRFLDVDLGDGHDLLLVSTYGVGPIAVVARGGSGDDDLRLDEYDGYRLRGRLLGGDGDDTLTGDGARDVLSGGAGDDLLQGGDGWDRLDGGPGRDRAVYTDYPGTQVRVTLPNRAPDADRLASIEGAEGSDDGDRLFGDGGPNVLIGAEGRDLLRGGGGRDVLIGGPAGDRIDSRDGRPDVVACGSGTDRVRADRRDDVSAQCERVSIGRPGR